MLMSGKDFRTGFTWIAGLGLLLILAPFIIPVFVAIFTFIAYGAAFLLLGVMCVLGVSLFGRGLNQIFERSEEKAHEQPAAEPEQAEEEVANIPNNNTSVGDVIRQTIDGVLRDVSTIVVMVRNRVNKRNKASDPNGAPGAEEDHQA